MSGLLSLDMVRPGIRMVLLGYADERQGEANKGVAKNATFQGSASG